MRLFIISVPSSKGENIPISDASEVVVLPVSVSDRKTWLMFDFFSCVGVIVSSCFPFVASYYFYICPPSMSQNSPVIQKACVWVFYLIVMVLALHLCPNATATFGGLLSFWDDSIRCCNEISGIWRTEVFLMRPQDRRILLFLIFTAHHDPTATACVQG